MTVLGLLVASRALADGALREGKWEVTTQMQMPGVPMQLPATTRTQCVTKALQIIHKELDVTMAFCGHTQIGQVDRRILVPGTFPMA